MKEVPQAPLFWPDLQMPPINLYTLPKTENGEVNEK